ncbi:MAG: monovalent cation/H(+) antiporter subunit G [Opitutales bacterium]|nr:monovalent cation/H(+) antiporter subunit G [Opitutales bacterium]NRA25740.1 monovalent cation/H(+) antiporter subunit G [Opitutales bacterium]
MDIVVAILIVLGAFFAFVAALGIVRMPDLYTRMHAATKAGAFGATLLLLAVVLHFQSVRTTVMAAIVIAFFYLTAPVAGQSLGRAAYRRKTPLWEETQVDRLEETGEIDRDS